MDKKNIEELRKILYSKIDQLWILIGDNFKTIHYDSFKINSANLDEKILKIREIFKQNPNEELEVLVMKKDIINLTKEFLDKDIIEELKQEKNKLKKIRIIYSIFLFILILMWTLSYENYFKKLLVNLNCPKIQCIAQKSNLSTNSKNIANSSWQTITWNNITSNKFTWTNITKTIKTNTNITWLQLTWKQTNLIWEKLTWIKTIPWNSLTWETLTGNKQVLIWQTTTWNQLTWVKTESKIKSITWNFLFWVITFHHLVTGNTYTWTMKILKVLKNKEINLSWFNSNYGFNKSIYSILKINKINWSWDTFSWTFTISWTIVNTILWEILTGKIYTFQPIDENEKKLSWKALKEYIQEKQQNCPYTGTIRVSVYALNLRKSNTKHSKKLWLLRKWTILKVLGCKKNLQANSWWYKVKTPSGKIGWVSTIGVSK